MEKAEKIEIARTLREKANGLIVLAERLELELDAEPARMSKFTNSAKGSLHWLRTILGGTMDVLRFAPTVSADRDISAMCAARVSELREIITHYEKWNN